MLPQVTTLPDGHRVHFHHGPTDLIVDVFGKDREQALAQATERFDTILTGLVAELPKLRAPYDRKRKFRDTTARRMNDAVAPFSKDFITPMAAVAGAVADEILAALTDGLGMGLERAYVNNGGDIAFYIRPGEKFTVAAPVGTITVTHDSQARGVATSGWGGRSHSLGIADAVTVVARSAAQADAAATMICNAVDLPGHPAIVRTPAADLTDDTDLHGRDVTTDVGVLTQADIARALDRGVARAESYLMHDKILGAALLLQGELRVVTTTKGIFPNA